LKNVGAKVYKTPLDCDITVTTNGVKHSEETLVKTVIRYEKQLLIPVTEINVEIAEGGIVLISEVNSVYEFEILVEETENMRDKVSSLLEKLENKK
jgi:hypothetical protein